MHEGNALDVVAGFDYTQPSPYGDTSKGEFRAIAGSRQMPQIIATGQTRAQASYVVSDTGPVVLDSTIPGAFHVNTLSVYDGRIAGVGRIVTGSTFHHYLDINLVGASSVDATTDPMVGGDAKRGRACRPTPRRSPTFRLSTSTSPIGSRARNRRSASSSSAAPSARMRLLPRPASRRPFS